MIKKGSSIIDVGITRVDDLSSPKGYRIVGDVDFKSVSNTWVILLLFLVVLDQ
ncbi:MAG: hypothetical protein CM15mP102_12720 [Flavobacteriales bacterium]|nr:MAG: hypothetical protein CM15mP102_12720 [Flavobacteriales bacterium]